MKNLVSKVSAIVMVALSVSCTENSPFGASETYKLTSTKVEDQITTTTFTANVEDGLGGSTIDAEVSTTITIDGDWAASYEPKLELSIELAQDTVTVNEISEPDLVSGTAEVNRNDNFSDGQTATITSSWETTFEGKAVGHVEVTSIEFVRSMVTTESDNLAKVTLFYKATLETRGADNVVVKEVTMAPYYYQVVRAHKMSFDLFFDKKVNDAEGMSVATGSVNCQVTDDDTQDCYWGGKLNFEVSIKLAKGSIEVSSLSNPSIVNGGSDVNRSDSFSDTQVATVSSSWEITGAPEGNVSGKISSVDFIRSTSERVSEKKSKVTLVYKVTVAAACEGQAIEEEILLSPYYYQEVVVEEPQTPETRTFYRWEADGDGNFILYLVESTDGRETIVDCAIGGVITGRGYSMNLVDVLNTEVRTEMTKEDGSMTRQQQGGFVVSNKMDTYNVNRITVNDQGQEMTPNHFQFRTSSITFEYGTDKVEITLTPTYTTEVVDKKLAADGEHNYLGSHVTHVKIEMEVTANCEVQGLTTGISTFTVEDYVINIFD